MDFDANLLNSVQTVLDKIVDVAVSVARSDTRDSELREYAAGWMLLRKAA